MQYQSPATRAYLAYVAYSASLNPDPCRLLGLWVAYQSAAGLA